MRLDGLFHFALIHAGTAVHCGGEHCARYAHCAHCGEHFAHYAHCGEHCAHCGEHCAHYAHCGEHCAHCGEQCAAVPLPGGSPQQQQQPVQVSRKPPYGGSEGMAEEYGSHIMAAISWWPYHGSHIMAATSWWPYHGGHIMVAISWWPYHGSHIMAEEYGSHIMVAQRELICFLATVDLSHCLDSTQTVFKSHISCLFSYVCLH